MYFLLWFLIVPAKLIQGFHASDMVRIWSDEPRDNGVTRRALNGSRRCPVRDVSDSLGDYAGQHACSSAYEHLQ